MPTTIENRLAKIERELDQLKTAIGISGAKSGWLSRLLGKEIRDAEEVQYGE